MKPHLANNDLKMFYKYLNRTTNYFEYGSGGSTYQASIRTNIQKIYSVESDSDWHIKLRNILKNKNNIRFIYNEMDTQPNTWGNPGPKSNKTQWINYSNYITLLDEESKKEIDLVMIDGRFRVACCLKCFSVINNDCLIAFDDFLNRPHYHIVLNFYDIVEKTADNRMVILKKKKDVESVPDDLIQKYELLKD
jgi:hypothetical protein